MKQTVFYSWQSDSHEETNRFFVKDCLRNAIRQVSKEAAIEEALRLDHDTKNIAGTPAIAATVFQKLDTAAVAIFDVTPIGECPKTKKALPNPNVLLELGYASYAIGWGRIICVMNADKSFKPEDLPFDLRHHRAPITYNLALDSADQDKITKKLTCSLKTAIATVFAEQHAAVSRAIQKLPEDCLRLIRRVGPDTFHCPPGRHLNEIRRLLDLSLLYCDVNPKTGQYAYHWGPIGVEVCKHLCT